MADEVETQLADYQALGDGVAVAATAPAGARLTDILQTEEFMIAAGLGAAIVLFDAVRRYNTLAVATKETDVIRQIAPRFLATNADYVNSFAIYILLRFITYAVPAVALMFIFMSGGVIDALGLPSFLEPVVTNQNFPLFWGAVIAGVLPSFSVIEDLEIAIRQFAQTLGAIPTGVRRMAREMRLAPLHPRARGREPLPKTDRFAFVSLSDFDRAADPIAQKWARLAYIFNYFKDEHAKHALVDKFSDAYLNEILLEENRFRSLQVRFSIHKVGYEAFESTFAKAGVGAPPRAIATHDPFLEADIDEMLSRFEIYLACALRSTENDDERAHAKLKELGFQVAPRARAGGLLGTFLGVGVGISAAAVLGSLAAEFLVRAAATLPEIGYPEAVLQGVGDSAVQRALSLMGYTLVLVTTVLVASFPLGTVLFGLDSRRIDERRFTDRPIAKYLMASLFGGACGMVALVGMVLPEPSFVDAPGKLRELLFWMPAFVTLGFMIHVFAYGPRRGFWRLSRDALIIGAAYAVAIFYGAAKSFEAQGVAGDTLTGAALYFAIVAFWIGAIGAGVFIQLNKLQRDLRREAEEPVAPEPVAPALDPAPA